MEPKISFRRWVSFSVRDLILTTAITGAVLGWWLEHRKLHELRNSTEMRLGQSVMKAARQRFDSINAVIEADKEHLLGKSLEEVCELLDLNEVPWDEGYSSFQEMRIYHFPGFYLCLQLELLPPGITPGGDWQSYDFTEESLRRDGVRWLALQYPSLEMDGVYDAKERMEWHWKRIGEDFEARNKGMQGRGKAASP